MAAQAKISLGQASSGRACAAPAGGKTVSRRRLHAGKRRRAIAAVHPDAVDVCSGVESDKGIKSVRKMREFVAAVRAAERQEP